MTELHHGGRLREASERYAIPLSEWLDLSTGINPLGWPVPVLPADCWQRLPEAGDGLEQAAAGYYGTERLLPVAGSQAAIQALPMMRARCRVGILSPAYAEHAAAWRREGHDLVVLTVGDIPMQLSSLDVLLLVNPNNPTGEHFEVGQLLAWHAALAERGGWLVVDEAFMDTTPEGSIAAYTGKEGLIVLRSLGKFFGLAGVRVGFALAWPGLLQRLNARLGPWAVSGPAREVARLALSAHLWQAETRQRLLWDSERLHRLLGQYGLPLTGGTALFQYCAGPQAAVWHEALARQGILTRLFDAPSALRFGLPGNEMDWQRLAQALAALTNTEIGRVAEC